MLAVVELLGVVRLAVRRVQRPVVVGHVADLPLYDAESRVEPSVHYG